MTFDVLVPEGRKGRVDETLFRDATEAAKGFAAEPNGWLAFQGSTGSGKTHLAAAIINSIVDRGSPAKYISALEVPDLLRNERFEENESADGGSFRSLLDAPVLVIDDLGAQHETNWVDSKIDQLLTHRFNGRMPTVVVLAKSIDEMPERIAMKLDDPSLSRISRLTGDAAKSNAEHIGIAAKLLERMTFENFNHLGAPAANHDEQASVSMALAAAREFVRDERPERWLYLHGPTGVGKTHLWNCRRDRECMAQTECPCYVLASIRPNGQLTGIVFEVR